MQGSRGQHAMAEEFDRPVPGAAVVCLRGDAVLLVRRGHPPNAGRWSFPGGKIEPGEPARAAAARETEEETGLRVRVLEVVDVYDALFPPYHYTVADYLAEPLDDREPQARSDVTAARWVPFEEVPAYGVSAEMERVLARARWLRVARRGAPLSLGLEVDGPLPAGLADRGALRARVCGLYVVTDATLVPGRTHLEVARAALAGGAAVVQLRDKQRDAGDLLPEARAIAAACRAAGALFLVNDRVDLAAACGADGVHLGQTDLPVAAARALLGPERLVGVSVENADQVAAAEAEGADYLGVGAIYGSTTKSDAGPPVGPEQLRRLRPLTLLPLVAIGGITAARIPEVRAAGADAVAVVGAVAAADDPAGAARELAELIRKAPSATVLFYR